MLYGADVAWWHYYAQEALAFKGLKVTCTQCDFREVLRLEVTGLEGFDPRPGCIRTGSNSAYQAAHIAAQAGARRILLCGVDLHDRDGSHHHGDHPSPLRTTSERSFNVMRERFGTLVEPLQQLGIEVFNCSPGSALRCFPYRAIEDAL